MEPKKKETGTDYGEEDKTIVVYTEWKNLPKGPNEIQEILNWVQNEIIKAFLFETEEEYIMGISPIQQSKELIQRANLIKSCVCCHHWKVNKEESRLVGTCQQNLKDISYDQICEGWEKII